MKTRGHLINIAIKRGLNFPYSKPWLKSIINCVLQAENVTGRMEIGCVITNDENIRKLNCRYRGIDEPTDVLSFAFAEKPKNGDAVEFPPVPGAANKFGDIVISYPRAAAQARALGHGIEDELTLLIVHGTLHLLNYDHQTASEARKMTNREKAIIKILSGAVECK